MSTKVYLVYTVDCHGNEVAVPVYADSREGALIEFDFLYGQDAPIDYVIAQEDVYTA